MAGGAVYDKITSVSDGLAIDTADESHHVNSSAISLPTLTDVSDGDVLRFYVRGNATASAEVLGQPGLYAVLLLYYAATIVVFLPGIRKEYEHEWERLYLILFILTGPVFLIVLIVHRKISEIRQRHK